MVEKVFFSIRFRCSSGPLFFRYLFASSFFNISEPIDRHSNVMAWLWLG